MDRESSTSYKALSGLALLSITIFHYPAQTSIILSDLVPPQYIDTPKLNESTNTP